MIKIKKLFLVFLIYLLPYPIYAQEIKILNMNNDLIEVMCAEKTGGFNLVN